MADVRPLPGLRYTDEKRAPETYLPALVTPPYDVISAEEQAAYYARDPHNIIRLELGRDEPGDDELENRYTRAAATFAEWRLQGILRQDPPSCYVYDQRFVVNGQTHTRRSLMARVRLEPWEAKVILPHERTLSKPKDDRLKLLRACAANLSPIMAMFDDPAHELSDFLSTKTATPPEASFTDDAGEEHLLWRIDDALALDRVHAFFAGRQLYIADGHHRYETALTYRDEMAAARKGLPLDDPAQFTLMALTAIEDPGLVVLPTHRILHDLSPEQTAALDTTLSRYFTVEPVSAEHALTALEATAATSAAFLVVLPERILLLRETPNGKQAMRELSASREDASDAWRSLDVAVLHTLLLDHMFGVSEEAIRAGRFVRYTRDAKQAIDDVQHGGDGSRMAVLLRPTPPAAIRDVAQAGSRMPQKSTYFYPKLLTGLVINPVW